jgi:hypothetical protein
MKFEYLKNYLEGDIESLEYAVPLEWNNIYYEDSPTLFSTLKKSVVRLGLIQWQMRSLSNLNALFEQAESLMLFLAMNVILHYFLSFFTAPLNGRF